MWKIVLEILMVIFTGGAVAAATYYAVISHRMWSEMQQQTCVQREMAVNSERAWIGLDTPVNLDQIAPMPNNRVFIKGHYSLRNFGHGPAIKVVQSANFLGLNQGLEVDAREAQSFCDSSIAFATGTVPVGGTLKQPPPFGYTLFPNQPHNESIEYQGPIETLKFLRFVGCVAYIDQFKTVHWARFAMWRGPYDPAVPSIAIPKLDFYSLYNDTDQPKGQPCHDNSSYSLADWSSISSILTFIVTFIGAAVGVFGYVKYLYGKHAKSKKLEEYLRAEKAKKVDQGQRSITQIVREVGLTEDEIIQVSFRNPNVGRRVKTGAGGFAEQLLFEYQGPE